MHYDLIVIGSGPGGASLARKPASTGKSILLLGRGDYLKREPANWGARAVFIDGKYRPKVGFPIHCTPPPPIWHFNIFALRCMDIEAA
jgi:choline dehydrogenase-like flavoprotein